MACRRDAARIRLEKHASGDCPFCQFDLGKMYAKENARERIEHVLALPPTAHEA